MTMERIGQPLTRFTGSEHPNWTVDVLSTIEQSFWIQEKNFGRPETIGSQHPENPLPFGISDG